MGDGPGNGTDSQRVVGECAQGAGRSWGGARPAIGQAARGAKLAVTRNVGDWVKVAWPSAADGVGYVRVSVGSVSNGAVSNGTAASGAPLPSNPTAQRATAQPSPRVTTTSAAVTFVTAGLLGGGLGRVGFGV